MLTVSLVSGVVVDEDQLSKLYHVVRRGAVGCELQTPRGKLVVVRIERTTDGKIKRMTVGDEEVDCKPLVIALGVRRVFELPINQWPTVLKDVAAAFGITILTGLEE